MKKFIVIANILSIENSLLSLLTADFKIIKLDTELIEMGLFWHFKLRTYAKLNCLK